MSKTTFYQIFECIFLKVLKACKYSQIHANSQASCAKKKKMPFHFFLVKWVYHKLYIFQFQIFDTNWPSLVYSNMEEPCLTESEVYYTYSGLKICQLPSQTCHPPPPLIQGQISGVGISKSHGGEGDTIVIADYWRKAYCILVSSTDMYCLCTG